jgi:hypothetical protein
MNDKIKIIIDPIIKDRYGPEVFWAWRYLLTSVGYQWEELPFNSPDCDIAYFQDVKNANSFRMFIHMDMDLWNRRVNLSIDDIKQFKDLSFPTYEGEEITSPPFIMEEGRLVCKRDIILDIFRLVTGQDEKNCPKDNHGFFDLSNKPALTEQMRYNPLASGISHWLEKKMLDLNFPPPIPRWPNGRQAAACLTHDVDYPEVKRLIEPLRIIRRKGLFGSKAALDVLFGKRTHWHIPSWVRLEKELGVRSVFYFCARQGSLLQIALGLPDPFYDIRSDRFGRLFEYLTDEGFEIGLHSSYKAFEKEEIFAAEKEILHQYSNQKIFGNRHHYWHLNPDDIESTLMIHETIGLRYDTSLCHERYIGWRRGSSWPFFPYHHEEMRQLRTLQISPTWMDDHLFGYLKFNEGNRHNTLQSLINVTAEQKGCLVVNIHDYVFDDVLFPDWKETYIWLVKKIIERSDYWIATPNEIADHWINRYNTIVKDCTGLISNA